MLLFNITSTRSSRPPALCPSLAGQVPAPPEALPAACQGCACVLDQGVTCGSVAQAVHSRGCHGRRRRERGPGGARFTPGWETDADAGLRGKVALGAPRARVPATVWRQPRRPGAGAWGALERRYKHPADRACAPGTILTVFALWEGGRACAHLRCSCSPRENYRAGD